MNLGYFSVLLSRTWGGQTGDWVRWLCSFLFKFFNVYLFLRERERAGAEGEGDRGSEAGSVLTGERPMRG